MYPATRSKRRCLTEQPVKQVRSGLTHATSDGPACRVVVFWSHAACSDPQRREVFVRKLLNDRRVLVPLILTAVAIAVGSLLIVVLSDDATSGTPDTASASQSSARGAVRIDITDFKFKPETVTVKTGTKVTWVNNDTAPHTATARDAFDTGTLRKGDKKTVKLKQSGTYAYVCEFHPFMKATVIVR